MKIAPIEYFYSAYSAYAYIGHFHFLRLAEEAGREVVHRPFDLMKCLNEIGYHPLEERTQSTLDYQFGRQRDRWSEYRQVTMPKATPSSHNNGAEIADLILIAAKKLELDLEMISSEFMQCHWLNNLDLNNADAMVEKLKSIDLDADTLMQLSEAPEVIAEYEANTNTAIKHSVFGSPTYFVDGDMFYGQDNLCLVERALSKPFA
jgi:2-hydroxychromene-2-carboxylate isomerase